MKRALALFLILATLGGCGGKQALLVGTWKAEPVKSKSAENISDLVKSGIFAFATQGMTVEFNDQDAFKVSVAIGNGKGNYTVSGDTVELKFESEKDQDPLKFKFVDNTTLELITEFQSDPKIVLKKL